MLVKTLLLALSLGMSSLLQADVLVIVNANNPIDRLERKQAVDLFMGRVSAFPGGAPAQTLDLQGGAPGRAIFYKILTGKSEAQVDAYWATLVFAGRMSPPKQLPNDKAMITAVTDNLSAIAYVTPQELPAGVKVVMELKSAQ